MIINWKIAKDNSRYHRQNNCTDKNIFRWKSNKLKSIDNFSVKLTHKTNRLKKFTFNLAYEIAIKNALYTYNTFEIHKESTHMGQGQYELSFIQSAVEWFPWAQGNTIIGLAILYMVRGRRIGIYPHWFLVDRGMRRSYPGRDIN
jgi:hypothetical protein